MSFQPEPNQTILIDDTNYYFAEHPSAPGVAYGQEGRAGTVFQLAADGYSPKALKVFKNRFRSPALVTQSDRLQAFARLAGLQVCQRSILTPQRHSALLATEPDLTYAALMPWITGPTWHDVLSEKQPLTSQQCLLLAHAFTSALAAMEQEGVAHCDLSGANLLLPALAAGMSPGASPIEFVDVEGLYGPGLVQPRAVPSGSSGYAHRTAEAGLWDVDADRFAGAVLLAEMLAWCDPVVREAAWGESLFDPAELQSDTQRYQAVVEALRRMYGVRVVNLLTQAWNSDTLDGCPTFGEWLVAIPQTTVSDIPVSQPQQSGGYAEVDAVTSGEQVVTGLMKAASEMEKVGQVDAAMAIYQQALALLPDDSPTAREIKRIVENTQNGQPKQKPTQVIVQEDPHVSLEEKANHLYDQAKIKQHCGQLDVAEELLIRALELNPFFGEAKIALVEVQKQNRKVIDGGLSTNWPLFWKFLGASTVGIFGVSLTAYFMYDAVDMYDPFWWICLIACGLWMGFFQWLVLRRYSSKSLWWIPVTMLSWLAVINISYVGLIYYIDEGFGYAVLSIFMVFIFPIITSWVQMKLLAIPIKAGWYWILINFIFLGLIAVSEGVFYEVQSMAILLAEYLLITSLVITYLLHHRGPQQD